MIMVPDEVGRAEPSGRHEVYGCRSRPDVDDRDKPGHDCEGDAFLQSARRTARPASWTPLSFMSGLVPVIHVVVYNRGPGWGWKDGAERAPSDGEEGTADQAAGAVEDAGVEFRQAEEAGRS